MKATFLKQTTLVFTAFVFLLFFFTSKIISEQLSSRIVSYRISAKLDVEKKMVLGNEFLKWKNTSRDIITELQFHLYLNAFKNSSSTFMKESGGVHRSSSIGGNKEKDWGWIDINSIKRVDGADLTKQIKFIQPDDGNKDDQTVISVGLDKPLRPGEEIELEIKFTSKLPKIFARTGFVNNYFLIGQWFPKIGVYEYPGIRYAEKGGWNCHQFHSNSEFYADFGVYDVDITVPSSFVVGAVGLLQYAKKNNDGTTTHHYRAEDVVDFAWTTSPDYKVVYDQWKHVKIKVMLQPEHLDQADRHINSAKVGLEFFDKNLGRYPYANLTVIDPPIYAMGAGGMEYPTFITAGTLWNLPVGVRAVEMVTIHEFGHNYFMGLLASNEFEEAFLDEGFNQYFETRAMDEAYGLKTGMMDFLGFKIGDFELTRQGYVGMKNPKIAEIFRKAWEYPQGGYGSLTYMKTAVMLKTLEGLIGLEAMNEIMKTYYTRWAFKHPCVKDFIAIANEVVVKIHGRKFGDNLNWYFDQVLYGSDICDYELFDIKNSEIEKQNGVFGNSVQKKFEDGNKRGEGKKYKSSVVMHRKGEVVLPLEVLITFDNGKKMVEIWDGKARTKEFSYEGKSKIVSASIDPFCKIPLDLNLINNSKTIEPESSVFTKYTVKFLHWLENAMLTFSMLF
ncbi:MAG: M1 family metallopeptidase [Melioribacteraceae bacterium]